MAPFDPSGIDLERQGLDHFLAFKDAQRRQDYGPSGNVIDQAVHMTGPLPDPQWQAFFQALHNKGAEGISMPKRGGGVIEGTGTNQFTGVSAQPDFFTGGDTFKGVSTTPYAGNDPAYAGRVTITPPPSALGQSVAALKARSTRPMPEDHNTFMQRLMGNDPESLKAAGIAPPTAPAQKKPPTTPAAPRTQPLESPPPLSTAILNKKLSPLAEDTDTETFMRRLMADDPASLAAAGYGRK